MKVLDSDWLIKGLIDYEYKKYMLLSYLQEVRSSFIKTKLYPGLADLVFHYRNLIFLRENQVMLKDAFPKELTSADLQKLQLNYTRIINDDEVMKEIEEILMFAIPSIKKALDEGKDIYEFVESQCEISSVGLSPLYANEGYMLVSQPPSTETIIYRYQITVFENVDEKYRGINTTLIEKKQKSSFYTYEQLKIDLVKQFKEMPNPATYLVTSKYKFPHQETLLPIAKRMLVKALNI